MDVLVGSARADLCDALRLFLSEAHIDVVGVAADPGVLLSLTAATHPEVVLLDDEMAPSVLPWLVAQLKQRESPPQVVLLRNPSLSEAPSPCLGEDACAVIGDPPDALVGILTALRPLQ